MQILLQYWLILLNVDKENLLAVLFAGATLWSMSIIKLKMITSDIYFVFFYISFCLL